jgi:hypothetical protein
VLSFLQFLGHSLKAWKTQGLVVSGILKLHAGGQGATVGEPMPSSSQDLDMHPFLPSSSICFPEKSRFHRVGTPVARSPSHRTVQVLFTYGSSGP